LLLNFIDTLFTTVALVAVGVLSILRIAETKSFE
jgi:hypothetical protein